MIDKYNDIPRRPVSIGKLKMTLSRDQIMTFVSGLHDLQMDMIEMTVASKERQGFPEATAVIKRIMEIK
jgi:hypothetical protein